MHAVRCCHLPAPAQRPGQKAVLVSDADVSVSGGLLNTDNFVRTLFSATSLALSDTGMAATSIDKRTADADTTR